MTVHLGIFIEDDGGVTVPVRVFIPRGVELERWAGGRHTWPQNGTCAADATTFFQYFLEALPMEDRIRLLQETLQEAMEGGGE